eukprot:SAG31_NODE_1646_length_7649_cov_3.317616_10_plen_119_part_00
MSVGLLIDDALDEDARDDDDCVGPINTGDRANDYRVLTELPLGSDALHDSCDVWLHHGPHKDKLVAHRALLLPQVTARQSCSQSKLLTMLTLDSFLRKWTRQRCTRLYLVAGAIQDLP